MRKRWINSSTLFILTGIILLLAATCMCVSNARDEAEAARETAVILAGLESAMEVPAESPIDSNEPRQAAEANEYLGILSIPGLELQHPVLAEWSYPNLKRAPCRYDGAPDANLTIIAHNYKAHFGRIHTLQECDEISLSGMDGTVYSYTVAKTETINSHAVENVGTYALTLLTCTPGGEYRIAVFCNAA